MCQLSIAIAGEIASDESLALGAAAGSPVAFGELADRYIPRLYRFLVQRSPSRADAEDIVQETLVKAYRNIGLYQSRWRFSTWIFTIATRELASRLRRPRLRLVPLDDSIAAPPAAEEHPGGAWAIARHVLTGESYAALWLRYAEDMSPREIGRILGRSRIWVSVSLHRSRRALAAELPKRGEP